MKAKEIRDLIDFISKSGLDEVNIETEEFKIAVKKYSGIASTSVEQKPTENPVTGSANNASQPISNPDTAIVPNPRPTEEKSKYVEIKSPMIGTLYMSPSPDSEPFVQEGDMVKAGQTVCVIEAMKLFNEIESEVSGKIVKMLVDNSSPVEFDQPLFLVDPS